MLGGLLVVAFLRSDAGVIRFNSPLVESDVDGSGHENWGEGDADWQSAVSGQFQVRIPEHMISRRSYRQLTDLQHEPFKAPRVVVHDDPTAVADHLRSTPKSDQACERPLLPTITLVQVDQHADTEYGDEQGVRWQAWLILEDRPFDAACFEGAAAPTTLLRVVGRHCLVCLRDVLQG